jgi:hypothetical protein
MLQSSSLSQSALTLPIVSLSSLPGILSTLLSYRMTGSHFGFRTRYIAAQYPKSSTTAYNRDHDNDPAQQQERRRAKLAGLFPREYLLIPSRRTCWRDASG